METVNQSQPIKHRFLAPYLSGRDNNLNLIRMIAASAVLVSHAVLVTEGIGAVEPLEDLTGMSLGTHAVSVFFVLSGLLIARSFDRGSSITRFLVARALRLFPALIVVLIVTVIAGAFMTSLEPAAYFSARETLTYVPRNLSLAFLQQPLPGLFFDNAYPRAANSSLWTLFYEVVCYGGVLVLGVIGVLKRRFLFSGIFALLFAAYVYNSTWSPVDGILWRVFYLIKLGFPFALGMMAYVWRERLVLDARIMLLLWVMPFVFSQTILLPAALIITTAYTTLFFGYVVKGVVLGYNRLGDYSYGIYIYAWPVQQTVAHLIPSAGPVSNMLISGAVTLALAVVSWHLIEKTALSKITPLADGVDRRAAAFRRAPQT